MYEIVIEINTSPNINGERVGIIIKAMEDNLVLSVAQDAL